LLLSPITFRVAGAKTAGVPEQNPREPRNPWYDPPPPRQRRHIRRRDKVEFAIAALLLAGLLGLLAFGVTRDDPRTPGPAATLSPR
jgi:hypothetical protein